LFGHITEEGKRRGKKSAKTLRGKRRKQQVHWPKGKKGTWEKKGLQKRQKIRGKGLTSTPRCREKTEIHERVPANLGREDREETNDCRIECGVSVGRGGIGKGNSHRKGVEEKRVIEPRKKKGGIWGSGEEHAAP